MDFRDSYKGWQFTQFPSLIGKRLVGLRAEGAGSPGSGVRWNGRPDSVRRAANWGVPGRATPRRVPERLKRGNGWRLCCRAADPAGLPGGAGPPEVEVV